MTGAATSSFWLSSSLIASSFVTSSLITSSLILFLVGFFFDSFFFCNFLINYFLFDYFFFNYFLRNIFLLCGCDIWRRHNGLGNIVLCNICQCCIDGAADFPYLKIYPVAPCNDGLKFLLDGSLGCSVCIFHILEDLLVKPLFCIIISTATAPKSNWGCLSKIALKTNISSR